MGTHNCNDAATCLNTRGSFVCRCKDGFTGDGEICTGMIDLSKISSYTVIYYFYLFIYLLISSQGNVYNNKSIQYSKPLYMPTYVIQLNLIGFSMAYYMQYLI